MTDFQGGLIVGIIASVAIYAIAVIAFVWWDLRRETQRLAAESVVGKMPRPAYTWQDPVANDQPEEFMTPARVKASVGLVTHSDGQIGRFGSYDRDVSPL